MFALDGIRVLDLTRLLPGGICTLMLADQGAEVIKIEQPGMGDYARWYVPRVGEYAAVFHAMNRNKKSVVLDLKHADGLAIFNDLVKTADVVIESFRPKVLPKLGITYNALSAINPQIIMCSLSGLGQTGAMANMASHDLNLAGMTGVLAAGDEQVLPIQAMDFGGAYLSAFAISSALFQRARTQHGTYIDAALLDSGLSLMTLARAESFARDAAPRPRGEFLTGGLACYRVYRTQDEQPLVLAALEPKFWRTFCQLAGRDDLATEDYLTPDEAYQAGVIAQVGDLVASKSHADWMEILAGSETCASAVQDVKQAADDPQIQTRDALYMADGVAHTYTPFKMGSRVAHQTAPDLGEHSAEILAEVGIDAARFGALQTVGIVG